MEIVTIDNNPCFTIKAGLICWFTSRIDSESSLRVAYVQPIWDIWDIWELMGQACWPQGWWQLDHLMDRSSFSTLFMAPDTVIKVMMEK